MARAIQLSDLLARVRDRADMQVTQFVTDAQFTEYINTSITAFVDLLVSRYGNDYYAKSIVVPILPNTSSYALPADFYKLLGVDVQLNGQGGAQWITLSPFLFAERNLYTWLPAAWNILGVSTIRYRLEGGNIIFIPTPLNANNVQLWYVPVQAQLVLPTDAFDFVNGWEEWVVLDAAIKALEKEESDTSTLERRQEKMEARIRAMAQNRDAGAPMRIGDVSRSNFWPTNGGGGS